MAKRDQRTTSTSSILMKNLCCILNSKDGWLNTCTHCHTPLCRSCSIKNAYTCPETYEEYKTLEMIPPKDMWNHCDACYKECKVE